MCALASVRRKWNPVTGLRRRRPLDILREEGKEVQGRINIKIVTSKETGTISFVVTLRGRETYWIKTTGTK